jgi:hypothetical protein
MVPAIRYVVIMRDHCRSGQILRTVPYRTRDWRGMDGEVCLQPLLRAGTEYHKACAAEWTKLFVIRENRA